MCVNVCKGPTQDFFTKDFGLPLTMVPDYDTVSACQKTGQRRRKWDCILIREGNWIMIVCLREFARAHIRELVLMRRRVLVLAWSQCVC